MTAKDRAVFPLYQDGFQAEERQIVSTPEFKVSAFRYPSGVEAVRLENSRGSLTILPFQGQQVWDADFDGKQLKMKAMRKTPIVTRDYLVGFGAFFTHCGFTAMGVPSKDDSHVLHGELHHAVFESASLEISRDGRGPYAAVSGEYRHIIAFNYDCLERTEVRLYADETVALIGLTATNNKKTPMEYMYMAHSNFRPVDGGRLVYSAKPTAENVKVRTSVPPHMKAPKENIELMNAIASDPAVHHILKPGMAYDPEIVMNIRMLADRDGYAHSMLVHPDGCAWYVRHKPSEFSHCMRWICRTPDQDCLGLAMPATAEPEGYTAEKAKGNVKTLAAGASVSFGIEAGLLSRDDALRTEKLISDIIR